MTETKPIAYVPRRGSASEGRQTEEMRKQSRASADLRERDYITPWRNQMQSAARASLERGSGRGRGNDVTVPGDSVTSLATRSGHVTRGNVHAIRG
eukprot:3083739-Rhodomonas_salina.1